MLRLFGRLSSLKQIITAIGVSILPGGHTHTHTHARTHARMHARTHTHTHTHLSPTSFLAAVARAALTPRPAVINAFAIMGIVMSIFAVLANDLYGEVDAYNFGSFSRSFFSMFQARLAPRAG